MDDATVPATVGATVGDVSIVIVVVDLGILRLDA